MAIVKEGPLQGRVRIYTRKWCWYCFAARRLLQGLGVEFDEIPIDGRKELRRRISELAGGWRTVPMIFAGDRFLGGFDEISELHRRGELQPLLENPDDEPADYS